VPPSINSTVHNEEHNVVIGKTVNLHCPASGVPPPKITWTKAGELLTFQTHPSIRVLNEGRQLEVRLSVSPFNSFHDNFQINNAQLVDIGAYKCHASSIAGNSSKLFVLHVLGVVDNYRCGLVFLNRFFLQFRLQLRKVYQTSRRASTQGSCSCVRRWDYQNRESHGVKMALK
jgi:hypothetical protein